MQVYSVEVWIISTDSRVLSSLHESLFAEQQPILLSETFGLLQRLNRVLGFYPLNGNFNGMSEVKLLFRFHFLINITEKGRIDREMAIVKLEKLSLYGRYVKGIINDAAKRLKGGK